MWKVYAGSLLLLAAAPAAATDATSNMSVTATVVTACTINTPDTLAFGTAITNTASEITAQANIPVICSNTGSYKVFLGNGSNYTASTRRMASGSNYLNYAVYMDAGRATEFPTSAASAVALAGTAAVVNTIGYGTIPVQTTPPPGAYIDTMQITVRY